MRWWEVDDCGRAARGPSAWRVWRLARQNSNSVNHRTALQHAVLASTSQSMGMLICILFLISASGVGAALFAIRWNSLAGWLFMGSLIGLSAIQIWQALSRWFSPSLSLRRHLLEHRMCGCCGYPISDISRGPEGCVSCPECSAAWKLQGAEMQTAEGSPGTGQAFQQSHEPPIR